MSLETYSNEIESLGFQIQFSVVGGLKILQMAMDRHPTLINLRIEISGSAELEEEVFGRILFLLSKVDTESQLSYDESIAAYLFCLSKEKPFSAYRACWSILDHGGLWWSVQLAHFVKHYNGQIIRSIDVSAANSSTDSYVSDDDEDAELNDRFSVSCIKGDLVLESLLENLKSDARLQLSEDAQENKSFTISNTQFYTCLSSTAERQYPIELVR